MITTNKAATALGVTRRRVLALIADGRLKSTPVTARMHLIAPRDLEAVRVRTAGRPRLPIKLR